MAHQIYSLKNSMHNDLNNFKSEPDINTSKTTSTQSSKSLDFNTEFGFLHDCNRLAEIIDSNKKNSQVQMLNEYNLELKNQLLDMSKFLKDLKKRYKLVMAEYENVCQNYITLEKLHEKLYRKYHNLVKKFQISSEKTSKSTQTSEKKRLTFDSTVNLVSITPSNVLESTLTTEQTSILRYKQRSIFFEKQFGIHKDLMIYL